MLAALNCLINIDHQDNPVIFGGNMGQINYNLLIVSLPCAGKVVAHMADCTRRMSQVSKENDVHFVGDLAPAQQQCGGVAVNRLLSAAQQAAQQPFFLGLVPAQAHHHGVQAGVVFGQADLLPLLQTDRHSMFLLKS